MFCNYCKSARPANEAPCPHCGAPSSLLGQFQAADRGAAGPVPTAWNVAPPGELWSNQVPQFSNNQVPQLSFDAPGKAPANTSWNTAMQQQGWGSPYAMAQVQEPVQADRSSMLPVPYQAPEQVDNQSMQLITTPNREQMLPALPQEQGESIYVEPIYTKPRPIIPRYRIISGFLSVLIMAALLCTGSVYYAKATGKITAVQRFFGAALPPNVAAPPAANIPNPPNKVDQGPGINIITAAATTSQVDANFTPRQADQIFQVGTPFYVTYSAKPPRPGNIVIKWYMNGNHYLDTVSTKLIDPKVQPLINGDAKMTYSVPAEGTVELYWSDQNGKQTFAQRLYFAVR